MSTQSDTYLRILESAKDLIYANSYADVGVAAICEKARVKKGSFYHFFPSKQELTLAVIDAYYADFKNSIIKNSFTSDLPPMARFERLFELAFKMQNNLFQQTGHVLGCPFGNLATELATQDETIRKKIEQLFCHLQNIIRDTLKEAVNNGDLESIDVDATAQAIFAYFEGIMLLAKTSNNPQLVQQLLPAASQILIKSTQ
jgi:TetR/AcrR family transcriptional repressor of nem operon